jgi:hypothetical protein
MRLTALRASALRLHSPDANRGLWSQHMTIDQVLTDLYFLCGELATTSPPSSPSQGEGELAPLVVSKYKNNIY